jgi:hypothetical protein
LAVACASIACGAARANVAHPDPFPDYRDVIARTAGMVSDPEAQRLVRRHGLDLINLTWEDTGRFKNSSVGPNISDMTIQVQDREPRSGQYRLTCMPVIRYPNFDDKSGDISPDRFYLLVGNERGRALRRVTLREFLGDLRGYLSDPRSWRGSSGALISERDTHVLVSAQACFLPVPRQNVAEFNPVLFNYQSYEGDPAVLAILATREGTSVTVIDNKRDGFRAGQTWGQRLFFNQNGRRASLTGQRLSDYQGGPRPLPGQPSPEAAGQAGLNMVLLIQVPLRQKNPPHRFALAEGGPAGAPGANFAKRGGRSDVEEAVIGHGRVEGPFTEIDGFAIERDARFPIRVTVQFYKATSNGVVSAREVAEISAQIGRVYRDADYVGSLVTEGDTSRPTEHDGPQAGY